VTTRDFRQLREDVFRHYVKGRHADALTLAERESVHFPERWGDTLYWRGYLTALVGDLDGALRLLKEAVDRGHWWSGGSLRGDPDLKVLQGDPQFEALVSVCRQRHAQAETSARPELLRLRPGTDPPWPLLMALHGAGGDAEEFSPHWQRATAEGWLVGIPQSSQMIAPGRFGWADQDRAAQEIRGHYQTIIRECRVDPGRVIMAGFSQGGATAIWMVLTRLLPARGFLGVACAPCDLDKVRAVTRSIPPHEIRGYLVVGAKDYVFGRARLFCETLQSDGVAARLEVRADLGHEVPRDFDRSLTAGLECLRG